MAQPNIVFDTNSNDTIDADITLEQQLLPTEAAYLKLLPELEALDEAELLALNLDPMAAVTTVTGALPEIVALRPQLEAELRHFDLAQFDKLEQYTLAFAHAHTVHLRASTPKPVQELALELSQIRDLMLNNALSLAGLGLFDAEQLRNVKTVTGYRALSSDVLTIAGVFKANWGVLAGKTPYTPAELLRVGNLALQLVNVVGLREQTPVVAGETAQMRQKAFTAFWRCYEATRRAVLYVRPNDGSDIAPALFTGRPRRRRADEEATAPEGILTENVAVSAESAPSVAPAAPSVPPQPPIVINNPAGLPIDSPFTA